MNDQPARWRCKVGAYARYGKGCARTGTSVPPTRQRDSAAKTYRAKGRATGSAGLSSRSESQ